MQANKSNNSGKSQISNFCLKKKLNSHNKKIKKQISKLIKDNKKSKKNRKLNKNHLVKNFENKEIRQSIAKKMIRKLSFNETERKDLINSLNCEDFGIKSPDKIFSNVDDSDNSYNASHQIQFEEKQSDTRINPFFEKNQKMKLNNENYLKIKKVLKSCDCIIQVLDARNPISGRLHDLENIIKSEHPDKQIILVLNKSDLVPENVLNHWKEILSKEYPTISISCTSQIPKTKEQSNLLSQYGLSTMSLLFMNNSQQEPEVNQLQHLIDKIYEEKIKQNEFRKFLKFLIVGQPSTGKSSLINHLMAKRVRGVSNKPFHTKSFENIHLTENIILVDSPPIFNPNKKNYKLLLDGIIEIDNSADLRKSCNYIFDKISARKLSEIYKVQFSQSLDQFIKSYSSHKWLHYSDQEKTLLVSRMLLKDWQEGKLEHYKSPPNNHKVYSTADSTIFN